MVSIKDDSIDFHKLEAEVQQAVEADARYWRENDAKFRAVHQKVATYEEFRDIVLASHLKPIDKSDRLDNIKFVQPWNQLADKSKDSCDDSTQASDTKQKSFKKPGSGHEFARDWRRLCKTSSDKYAFLLWLGADTISRIFKAEISFGLLGDILSSVSKEYRSGHCSVVVDILQALSDANRFKLSVDFLSQSEKDACAVLFERILKDVKSVDLRTDVGGFSDNKSDNSEEIPQQCSIDLDMFKKLTQKYGIES